VNLGELVGDAPYLCGPDTSITEAASVMEGSDLGSLAVVEGMTLLGLVTERDIRRAVSSGVHLDATHVSEIMSGDPDTFDPDLDVWDAAAWLVESGYRHMPVVNDDGSLMGVVSIRDLLKSLVDTV
jgi:CBS domain-containing protein